jgi:hypothetical protein
MNRDPRLPPRPPKLPLIPKGFFDWGFWLVVGINVLVLGLNGYLAYQGRAHTWGLAISCGALAMTLVTLGFFAWAQYQRWTFYHDVRIAFEMSLDAIEAVMLEILDGGLSDARREYWARAGVVIEDLNRHMEGFR